MLKVKLLERVEVIGIETHKIKTHVKENQPTCGTTMNEYLNIFIWIFELYFGTDKGSVCWQKENIQFTDDWHDKPINI